MTTLLPLLVLIAASISAEDAPRYERLCAQVAAAYDSARGGFATRDGAPVESAVELAFALARDGSEPAWKARALRTVQWTRGLFDSTGGGFYQRLRDADPSHPSFEKRTDSNARRLGNLIDAWQTGGGDEERRFAARSVDYFDRVLLDARGGFVAGQGGNLELVPETNGLAIHAWLRWAAVTGDARVRDFGLRSLDRLWEQCWNENAGLLRRGTFGELKGLPLLTDQVEMGRAYVLGAHVGGRQADLDRACTLGNLVLERFEDPKKGGFAENALTRGEEKVRRGGRDFGKNARAVRFLAELSSITGDSRYREAARRSVAGFAKELGKADGGEAAEWALAIRSLFTPDFPRRPEWKEGTPPPPRSTKIERPVRKKR